MTTELLLVKMNWLLLLEEYWNSTVNRLGSMLID